MRGIAMAALVGLSVATAAAQQSGVYVGAHVALQYCRILNEQDQQSSDSMSIVHTFKPMNGFDIGWQIAPSIGIETGILISQQGQIYKSHQPDNKKFLTELSYVKIPLVVTYKTSTERKLSFTIMAGAQYSILYRAETSRRDGFGLFSSVALNARKYYKDKIWEYVGGLGFQYNVSEKIHVFAQFRGDFSAEDIEAEGAKPAGRAASQNLTITSPQMGVHLFF